MISMVLLGSQIAQQLEANPEGLQGVELSWQGESLSELATRGAALEPDVVVAELDLLGPEPRNALRGLRGSLRPEMVLVIYSYAKRDVVSTLQSESIRVLQGPVSLSALRSQMLGLIVRHLFEGDTVAADPSVGDPSGDSEAVTCPRCGSQVYPKKLSTP